VKQPARPKAAVRLSAARVREAFTAAS
jgi:hypothetical protein